MNIRKERGRKEERKNETDGWKAGKKESRGIRSINRWMHA